MDLETHPYIVRAHFVDRIANRNYIAMSYVAPNEEGINSLAGYLQSHPPDLSQCLRWAIQICYGMEHAYSRGIRAHRDLKPANILIGYDNTVKITDFGLAGVLEVEGAAGTPSHMPPEQFTDAASCDERSDIYAFGVVLYQMVTGGESSVHRSVGE
ncbi:MAG: serine/threonine-protein kinase [Halobacteriota archaeon]